MCGDIVTLPVTVDASLSHSGSTEVKRKPIDRCIAPIVMALEAAGIYMLGSCCGHGERDGTIVLADGRTLTINMSDV